MASHRLRFGLVALALAWALGPGTALAASCGNTAAGFSTWLASFKKQAAAAGISQGIINSALGGVTYSSSVIALDRKQHKHFTGSLMTPAHVSKGSALLRQKSSLFKSIEAKYGVPGSVIVAIWGLETGFGANVGNTPIFRSLATLAYDCRRSAFFTNELMAALKIAQRGDLSVGAMRGAWAGEMGQTQFLASKWLQFAVGGRDLIHSSNDALASTANYLKGYGWAKGQPWGPGTHNFQVLQQWNKSENYCRTIAQLASKIAGS